MNPSSNQTFSLVRFGRLFSRHTAEHLPAYLMTAAVGTGGMLLVMGFITYLQRSALGLSAQMVFFILFLLAGCTIFTSTVFAQFGTPRQASVALTLPASHLEKFLVAWVYSLPVFVLAFVPMFYLADAAAVYAGLAPGQTPELLDLVAARQDAAGTLCLLAAMHAAWLWGGIRFENKHFVKTGFAMLLLLGGLSVINFQILKRLAGVELMPAPLFTGLRFMEGQQYYSVDLPDAQAHWLALLPLGLAALLWAAAYFRLTEKQL
ncbi:hypothetical protein [Hymenobacter sp. IS2118]|uniref:hypothetical protein n=1 Tax=Hymenobacter sp. IS2118 TaxID=1505605 RepID=UPI00054CFD66|nr:hypothetical protein [Hymenobacter sp. IS2118]